MNKKTCLKIHNAKKLNSLKAWPKIVKQRTVWMHLYFICKYYAILYKFHLLLKLAKVGRAIASATDK